MATVILAYWTVMSLVGIVSTITSVGKPKRPATPGFAAVVTLLMMLNLVGYAYLYTQL